MCRLQFRKFFVPLFVGLLYQFIQHGGTEFLCEQGIGQRYNILVVLLAIVVIWTAGQSIRTVQRSRSMMNFEVVVGQGEDICYALCRVQSIDLFFVQRRRSIPKSSCRLATNEFDLS